MNPLRRNFFKGFGVLGAVVAGATAVKVTVEEIKKPSEDHSHLAPEPNTTLSLMGDNRSAEEKKAEMQIHSNGLYVIQPNMHVTNQVALAVGKDNRLWIKTTEDKWHRVSIDS